MAGAALIVIALIPVIIRETSRSEDPLDFAEFDARTVAIMIWGGAFLVALSFSIMSGVQIAKPGRLKNWNWELHFVMFAVVYTLSLSLANFWHLPMLMGRNPREVWVHNAEGTEVFVLLALDGLVTAIAMYVPVRSCISWLLFPSGVGCYFVMLVAVDSVYSNDRHLTVGALLCLTFFALHGGMRNEVQRRKNWQALMRVQQTEEVVEIQRVEIEDTNALAKGMVTLANSLCDVVVPMTSEMHVQNAKDIHNKWFEKDMEGQSVLDFMGESDQARFRSLLVSVSKRHAPLCLPVTIHKKSLTSECHLLLVDNGADRPEPRYLLGIRVEGDRILSQQPSMYVSEIAEHMSISSNLNEFLGLVPTVSALASQNAMSSWNREMMDRDSDFSFTTYPKNMPPPPPSTTPAKWRAKSIRKLIPRWSIQRDPDSCCHYHTVVQSMQDVIDYMRSEECEPLWSTLSGGQCQSCKCMCTKGWQKCVVCGTLAPDGMASRSIIELAPVREVPSSPSSSSLNAPDQSLFLQ
eukprot:TRINITY_DN31333_c0_g2_i1.p1 TRINITY_DN31333_c0_g2~~TRINITY_DN31333_c0_g2_i1.p1  ORF type:complete len:602 (-),score=72.02 TRINITY_DN31333_c0_g2_i1:31-1593(-)